MLKVVVTLSQGRREAPVHLRCQARSTRGPIFRLRVKGVRLRGKTREASLCLIRFGTLVCYTAVCFS